MHCEFSLRIMGHIIYCQYQLEIISQCFLSEAFISPPFYSPIDRDDISEETEETIDQVAVLTSNVLFFMVMFIFAIFETYVFHCRIRKQSKQNVTDHS